MPTRVRGVAWRVRVLGDYRPFGPPRRRRWGFVSWWFSLLLVMPGLGVAGVFIYQEFISPSGIRGTVVNAYTNNPVSGAVVAAGALRVESDGNGRFLLKRQVSSVVVQKSGYDTASVTIASESDPVEVRLRPNVIRGTVRSRATQQPVDGASVEAVAGGTVASATKTDQQGAFVLRDVPAGASLVVDSPDYARVTVDASQITEADFALRPDVITGAVTDDQGKPLADVSVVAGSGQTTTGKDGSYRLEGAPDSGNVIFKLSGYRAEAVPLNSAMNADAKLTPIKVRAIYATAETVSRPDQFNALLDTISQTELNAMVVDLKDSTGYVLYDTRVQLAHDIGAVKPLFDARQLIQTLHQRGIYAIARIVVFEDPVLAEARPAWAIHTPDGELWRTWDGLAWVNAYRSEVWNYDIALATEAASLGFDEIQFDYIRFPSDGPLEQAVYGVQQNQETRSAAIRDFLTKAHSALADTKAYLGVDVFGLTFWELGDSGIGQRLEDIVPEADYISPMLYPSHFAAGSMGFDIPNDHPYDVVLWSLENGAKRVPNDVRKFRPWLQDFSLGPGIAYGDNEVRQQIQAADQFGSNGWMLWNAANVYHKGALKSK